MADLTLEQAQRAIKNKLEKAIYGDNIKNVVSEFHKQAIQTEVYDTYDPTEYIRRYNNGGLMDDDNFDWDIYLSDDTIFLLMKNITDPINGSLDSDDLMNIIEKGEGYDWRFSDIYKSMPYPRPFIEKTNELLKENKELLIEVLKKELIKNGLKVE